MRAAARAAAGRAEQARAEAVRARGRSAGPQRASRSMSSSASPLESLRAGFTALVEEISSRFALAAASSAATSARRRERSSSCERTRSWASAKHNTGAWIL